ncbi:hypothetical protein UMC2_13851 [[Clostridium] sordellii]|uniref:hypothetical protein n=1 Tax=Paraclostridium sordellii TaxID=1505 RepID=UPI0005422CC7|nr:hypothetical protein [Paeniclostridium sordellii]CEK34135.1 hypothetical protein UMC2_13851 [[Clostridium] sordellii] [Paeniclostridium sordellii]
MKLTNKKIVNDSMILMEISRKELPIKVSYALAKNISKIEKELEIYNSERQKLLDKYCVKDENGKNKVDENNQLKIQEEYLKDWEQDIKELQNIELEIDIHKFKIDELNGYNMAPSELMAIDYMIED